MNPRQRSVRHSNGGQARHPARFAAAQWRKGERRRRGRNRRFVENRIMLPELQTRFDTIETQKTEILRRVRALDDARLNAAPKPGEWSPREIVQHLVMAEESTVAQIAAAKTAQKPLKKWLMTPVPFVIAILRAGIRVPAPASMMPVSSVTLEETIAVWDEQRTNLHAHLDTVTDSRIPSALHPAFGPLDAVQLLDITDSHLTYHRKQLDRLGIR